MAKTKAYQCDAPDCDQVAVLEARIRSPKHWPHVVLVLPLSGKHEGSVCSAECASAWIEDLMREDAMAEMEV